MTNRVIIDALAMYRSVKAREALDTLKSLSGISKANMSDRNWVDMDRARQCFAESERAHTELNAMLGWSISNPDYGACDHMADSLRAYIGTRAIEAFERLDAEHMAEAEEASIARYHNDAYGE